jgi:hypothetical protein
VAKAAVLGRIWATPFDIHADISTRGKRAATAEFAGLLLDAGDLWRFASERSANAAALISASRDGWRARSGAIR